MNTFLLVIVAYDKVVYNGPVVYCGVTTLSGSLGLEARHEPILGVLQENSSILFRDSTGSEESVEIKNGMFSFKDNKCVITVGVAVKK